MIHDGRRGYVSGDLSQANNTVLAMTKGPIKGRNWNYTSTNPSYSITISAGATGTVKLQGTNDVAYRSDSGGELTPIENDLLPTDAASWADLSGAATAVSVTGTITVEYQFLRLIIIATGTGFVNNAWVRWA